MMHRARRACVVFIAAAFAAASLAANAVKPQPPLDVTFTDCVESIGVGLAPTPNVVPLTGAGFVPVGAGTPVSPVVVRTADCAGIAVDGHKPKPGSVVQIGAVIIPPDLG